MRKRFLTALLAVMLIAALGVISASAEGTTVRFDGDSYEDLKTAIQDAADGTTIVIPEEVVITGGGVKEGVTDAIYIDSAITIKGEGDRTAGFIDMVFDIESTSSDHDMSVTFENLSFTGESVIKIGYHDKQNSAHEDLKPTELVVDNCYVRVTHSYSGGASFNAFDHGQFISLNGTYNTNLDLTITDSTLINASTTTPGAPSTIVRGNGTNIVRAEITGNTIGSEEDRCTSYPFKFARRQDGAVINIDGNTIYSRTSEGENFYILDLYQSGSNPYNGLTITVNDNTIHNDDSEGGEVYAAEVEDTVCANTVNSSNQMVVQVGDLQVPKSTVKASGNKVNDVESNNVMVAAKYGDTYYPNLHEAIVAADEAGGGTVELLRDVTYEKVPWPELYNISDVTIEGNGYTLKVNNLYDNTARNYMLQSAGNVEIHDLKIDVTGIKGDEHKGPSTAPFPPYLFASYNGDVYDGVEVIGAGEQLMYVIAVYGDENSEEPLTITNCNFSDCTSAAIYDNDDGKVKNIVITDSTFTDTTVYLRGENAEFTGNELSGGKLNIYESNQLVSNTAFKDGSEIEFHTDSDRFK